MKTHDLTFAKRPEILAAKIMAYECTNISFSPNAYLRGRHSVRNVKEQEAFISATKETIILAGGFNVGDVFPSSKLLQVLSGMKPKLEKIHWKIDKILAEIINENKVNKTITKTSNCESGEEDLVDVLLRLQECSGLEFPITTKNIKAVLLVSIFLLISNFN
ncbi:hypothetical protein HHK36_003387 [Tetracentron sinense]|uniref:Uncharacterized protein n=1 Tax=Tetracentron sinense TaxID=13715 RepID=A0A834ZSF2_TETSI|nr:hypothetical protein HHK36_003387 [Tetracentron sinense]